MIGIDTTFLIAAVHEAHSRHQEANQLVDDWIEAGERLALCSHVAAEFLHVITDARRFERPLSMEAAIQQIEDWTASEQVRWFDTRREIILVALEWMRKHQLGRKRILDTFVAATYAAHQITRLATLNPADFRVFDIFDFLPAPTP